MSPGDWFRQTTWSAGQAASFFQRLERSRSPFHRAQYLRVQAVTLANSGERDNLLVALDRYSESLQTMRMSSTWR
jgi:hypothetical protein